MSEPHACGQAFSANITDREHHIASAFEEADKIPGEVTYGKNLTGNLKGSKAPVAWSAKSSLHLGSLKERASQIIVLTAQSRKVFFESSLVA
jgi:hypothetical protein